jgi:hypothetical protein
MSHVAERRSTNPHAEGARHSPSWYVQASEDAALRTGDRFFVLCEGGPCTSRLETYPPRVEIEERDGIYVLVDDGPRAQWCYLFIPHTP